MALPCLTSLFGMKMDMWQPFKIRIYIMGGGISSKQTLDIRPEWLEILTAMSLNNNDLKRLKKVFDFIDDEKQGSVSINKVLDFLFVGKTRFNKRLFSTLDKDRTGTVDFYSFIVSLWKFLPLESTSISKSS